MLNKIKVEDIKEIAYEAGEIILNIYKQNFLIEYKNDKSPLTEADSKSNEFICSRLKELYPNIPIISEENKLIDYNERKEWDFYWCIDPIDGTKEFIQKNDEFTVNIALVEKKTPVLGVVYAPALSDMYWAKRGEGSYLNNEILPKFNNDKKHEILNVVASKSHLSRETQEFIDSLKTKNINQISKGSSLKLCMIATGEADIYPRLGPTMEWDTAAADAIVRESGMMSYQYASNLPLIYNKKELLNPFFVVCHPSIKFHLYNK